MPALKTFKLFISHALEEHEDYARLIELLNDASNFSYSVYSVPNDPKYKKMSRSKLEEDLRKQMRPVNCIVILDGVYESDSDWAQFELDYAVSLKKPIVGIRKWKSKDISDAIEDVANAVVGWNPDSVLAAIKEHSTNDARVLYSNK